MAIKHRKERRLFTVDFSLRLAVGETLSGTPIVEILEDGLWDGLDVTAKFRQGEPAVSINGSSVEFWMKGEPASPTPEEEQSIGIYAIKVTATTNAGSVKVAGSEGGGPLLFSVVG